MAGSQRRKDDEHREEDGWKYQNPYRVREASEDFEVKWTGSCQCGMIQYQLSRERPLASKFCHCTTCQQLHGVSSCLSLNFKEPKPSYTLPPSGWWWIE